MRPDLLPRARIIAVLLAVISVLLAWRAERAAHAGDRPLELVLVWLGKDSAAVERCHDLVSRTMVAEYTEITTASPERVAKRLKLAPAQFAADWFRLPDEDYRKALKPSLRPDDDPEDTVMLIACDPDARLFRAVLHTPGGTVYRARFHHVPLDEPVVRNIAEVLVFKGYSGYSP